MINHSLPHANRHHQDDRPTKTIHYRQSHPTKHENQIDRRNLISYIENHKDKIHKTTRAKPTTTNVYQTYSKASNGLKHGETTANKTSKSTHLPSKFITVNPSTLSRLKTEPSINNQKSQSTLNLNQPVNQEYLQNPHPHFQQQQQQQNRPEQTFTKYSYIDVLKMYQKQRFLEEYLRNNGDAASQIIPQFLYLGGHNSIIDTDALKKQGVTHVLNMAQELNLNSLEYSEKNIKILQIGARDTKDYNIRADFDLAFMFIDDCLRTRGKIIVNCARGISRSATIVISYLMFRYNLRLADAYKLVVNLRPQVKPNISFRQILILYDQELNYVRAQKLMNSLNKLKDNQRIRSSPISAPLIQQGMQKPIYARS